VDEYYLVHKNSLMALGGQLVPLLAEIVKNGLCQDVQLAFVGETGKSSYRSEDRGIIGIY
jgi:hypothetical protein